MIDTDKYEGHEEGHQAWQELVKDAPLILEAYKRLREQIQLLHDTWFADEEMASDVDERMTVLLREMIG